MSKIVSRFSRHAALCLSAAARPWARWQADWAGKWSDGLGCGRAGARGVSSAMKRGRHTSEAYWGKGRACGAARPEVGEARGEARIACGPHRQTRAARGGFCHATRPQLRSGQGQGRGGLSGRPRRRGRGRHVKVVDVVAKALGPLLEDVRALDLEVVGLVGLRLVGRRRLGALRLPCRARRAPHARCQGAGRASPSRQERGCGA